MKIMKRSKKKLIPLGQLLIEKAKELGLSEKEFAEKILDISANYFYLLKYGEKGQKAPRAETIRKIAKVLKIPPKQVWDIIEQNLESSSPSQPFPGFNEVMIYPAEERAYQIDRLAVEHVGIPVEMVAQHLEKYKKDLHLVLKTEKEIEQYYKERLQFWQKKAEKIRKILEEEE